MSKTKQTPIPPKREEILAIYTKGPEAVVELVESLFAAFSEHIIRLEGGIKDLEDLISKDSHNSSKPPSSDGFRRKPKSQRSKGKRKAGGQRGHK